MGYPTTNAALAYDMRSEAQSAPQRAPQAAERPRLDVITGAGRESSQAVSPIFTHCVKVFALTVALFFAVGIVRVTIAGATAGILNQNAALATQLETAQDESASLEVMRSVYGSSTRIRDLAEGYGMVAGTDAVVLDFTEQAPAADSSQATADQQ